MIGLLFSNSPGASCHCAYHSARLSSLRKIPTPAVVLYMETVTTPTTGCLSGCALPWRHANALSSRSFIGIYFYWRSTNKHNNCTFCILIFGWMEYQTGCDYPWLPTITCGLMSTAVMLFRTIALLLLRYCLIGLFKKFFILCIGPRMMVHIRSISFIAILYFK